MSQIKILQNLYLFKNLSESQLEIIDNIADIHTYNSGDIIFSQKDVAKALYVIQYGSVRIHHTTGDGDQLEIAILGTGSHFGEMALLDDEPRSASATAIEKSDVIIFEYEKLNELLKSNLEIAVHFYKQLSHFLCGRLRITTNDLSFSRSQNLSHF